MKHQSLPALRVWLQSTALLTVIAGYTVLLVINSALADLQRRDQHQRLLEALTAQALTDQLDPASLEGLGIKALHDPLNTFTRLNIFAVIFRKV